MKNAKTTTTISGYVDLNGTRLFYQERGSGFPLLLVHAGVADSRMWDPQFETWSGSFRVIACDLRGFGRTELAAGDVADHEDLARLLTHLKVERAMLVGASYGGQVAIDLALAFPDRVAGLVLVAPNVGGWPAPQELKDFGQAEGQALDAGNIDVAVDLNVRTWVDGPQRDSTAVDSAVRNLVATMQRQIFEIDIPAGFVPKPLEPPAWGRLEDIHTPTLVLTGDLDLDAFRQLADEVAGRIPEAVRVILPGVAHMASLEGPAAFDQAVLPFLRKHAR